ncbi:hypothetical protein [Mesorhizobium helmanticense]|uniref:Uncharacterized protein n=1 Tax=Mesorhizobium helmanticense TaxID=1776423 RepID=A0A2T4IXE8_9HYPH|nr:hypothetical protein [Mesorhizobium helmanticense]PTE10329.1 hypothetical protein C9427_12425 [Mesorhizobium helmanticense]
MAEFMTWIVSAHGFGLSFDAVGDWRNCTWQVNDAPAFSPGGIALPWHDQSGLTLQRSAPVPWQRDDIIAGGGDDVAAKTRSPETWMQEAYPRRK